LDSRQKLWQILYCHFFLEEYAIRTTKGAPIPLVRSTYVVKLNLHKNHHVKYDLESLCCHVGQAVATGQSMVELLTRDLTRDQSNLYNKQTSQIFNSAPYKILQVIEGPQDK
jgi:hypothetical protein